MIGGLPKEVYPATPVLLRPDPETATGQDIVAAREGLLAYNWEVGCSYGHIVIDDYNMGDGSIFFCLNTSHFWNSDIGGWDSHPERGRFRREWIKRQLEDNGAPPIDGMEFWEQYLYADVLRLDAEITRFLRWLSRTTEEARDDAWCLLNGEICGGRGEN